MEARELRIGNHAKHFENGIVLTVGRTVAFKTPTNTIRVDVDDLEPIPLTAEWLLNFGFKSNINKHSGCGYSIFGDFKLWIDNNKTTYWKVKGSVELKHVHQLQNLYHALTNEELTINK